MNKDLVENAHHQTFESLREEEEGEEGGSEFWSARKLAKVLEYSEYRHFLPVIEKAKEACNPHSAGRLRLRRFFLAVNK